MSQLEIAWIPQLPLERKSNKRLGDPFPTLFFTFLIILFCDKSMFYILYRYLGVFTGSFN